MNEFLHGTEKVSIRPLPEGLTFTDLPQVITYFEDHADGDDDARELMLSNISHIVADIFAFSLLLAEEVADQKNVDLLVRYNLDLESSIYPGDCNNGPLCIRIILEGHMESLSELEFL